MKPTLYLAYSLLLGLPLICHAQGRAAEPQWQVLCNGRDLTGWTSDKPNLDHWRVEDGVIIGANGPEKKGSVIWTDDKQGDFVLQVDFRFSGVIDSGIFLKGGTYQINIGNSSSLKRDMTCCIYAPKDGRGKYPAQAEGREKILKKDDWNTVQIEARGKRIVIRLNGTQVVDYETKNLPTKGPIGLQVHAGHEMKVEFRNPRMKPIKQDPSAH